MPRGHTDDSSKSSRDAAESGRHLR